MKSLVFFWLAATLAVPATAATPSPMSAMNYYVGTWSCDGAARAKIVFALDDDVLTTTISIPVQGDAKQTDHEVYGTSYDAKQGLYVQAGVKKNGSWSVAYAKPWSGNTESWIDHSPTGKLAHEQHVRVDANTWMLLGYPSMTAVTPNFKVTCRRAM